MGGVAVRKLAVVVSLLVVGAACADDGAGDGAAGGDGVAVGDRPTGPGPGGLRFTEVTAAAGLDEPHSELDLPAQDGMSSGAAVADVNGDGHLDIYLTRVGRPNALYLNDGEGRFTDVAAEAGVAGPSDRFGSSAAAFADFDGDGHLDLFVTGYGWGENQLFMNNGDGTFREESALRGLDWPPLAEGADNHSYGVAVADVNGSGHMDLLVLHWYADVYNELAVEPVVEEWYDEQGEPREPGRPQPCDAAPLLSDAGYPRPDGTPPSRSALFLNDGTGDFTDETEAWGLPLDEIVAFTATFVDLDGDGWVDLGITGDGCTSRLFRNVDGERFEDVTAAAGVGDDENGMGAVMRDLTGNGHPDWFITSIFDDAQPCPTQGFFVGCSGNRLYANEGDGTFTDATDRYGVRDGGWGWGVVAEDFNNDGRIEIAMNNGFRQADEPEHGEALDGAGSDLGADGQRTSFAADATRFWVLEPGGERYEEVAAAIGIDDTTTGHALIAFDMDGDGRLDLLSAPTGGEPRLWRNDSTVEHGWLRVALEDPSSPGNPWGDGARVEVTVEAGEAPSVGWITTTGSYESQRPPEFHVGLGDHSGPVHRVEVHWPPPHTARQVLEDVDANQRLVVRRDAASR